MNRCAVVLLTLFASAAVAADDEKEKAIKVEKEKLRGKWKLVSIEREGKEAKPPADTVVVIDGEKWVMETPRRVEMAFSVEPTTDPKTIDRTITARGAKGKTSERVEKGIYKLEQGTLTVCTNQFAPGAANKDRPKEFKSTEGREILVYKRVEK